MATHDYYATYCRFFTCTKDEAGLLLGADCCVGDRMTIEVEDHALSPEADLVNRFGAVVGHLNPDMAQQVLLARAKGWVVRALLASVYYSEPSRATGGQDEETQGPGYWGEIVLMCFADSPAFRAFCDTVAKALGEGARPAVELGTAGTEQVAASQGSWLPEGRVPKPEMPAGTAVVKDHLTLNEKMVEQARRRDPGCMAAGWAFIILVVALVAWLILRLIQG